MKHLTLRSFGLIGTLSFLPLFILTFVDSQLIEKTAETFIASKVDQKANDAIEAISLPEKSRFEILLGKKAAKLRQDSQMKLDAIKVQLQSEYPRILSDQIAKLQNLDCDCRNKWEQSIAEKLSLSVISLEAAKEKVIQFSHTKYMEVTQKLTRDVRIFLATNSLVFLTLMLVSFLKPQAIQHLFLPGLLLLTSSIVCSYFYLFEQNWFYTIIYNNYTGYGFTAYLAIVYAFLCDIVFNRARVTTEIINGLLETFGQTLSLSPC